MTNIPKKKKSNKRLIILILVFLIISAIVSTQLVVNKQYNLFFSQRYSSQNNKEIMEFKDYDDLQRQGVHFSTEDQEKLKGYFYSTTESIEKFRAVIVFSHAFGNGGHNNYLPEINYFAQKGYLCFAFDNLGNDESAGSSINGFPQAVIDLDYALLTLKDIKIAKGLDIMLFGEDLGAYAVSSVLQNKMLIKSAICISGFNSSEDLIVKEKKDKYGNFLGTLSAPFVKFSDMSRFNDKAYYSTVNGLEKTNANVLIMHSQDDKIVPINKSFDVFQKKLAKNKNITFKKFTTKGHNITRSDEANKYNQKKLEEKAKLKKDKNGNISNDDMEIYMKTFDKKLSNQLDENVMNEMLNFYENSRTKK